MTSVSHELSHDSASVAPLRSEHPALGCRHQVFQFQTFRALVIEHLFQTPLLLHCYWFRRSGSCQRTARRHSKHSRTTTSLAHSCSRWRCHSFASGVQRPEHRTLMSLLFLTERFRMATDSVASEDVFVCSSYGRCVCLTWSDDDRIDSKLRLSKSATLSSEGIQRKMNFMPFTKLTALILRISKANAKLWLVDARLPKSRPKVSPSIET